MSESENNWEERQIWCRFLKGDHQVLSLIYLKHYQELFDYGCRFTIDRDLAKDCIQEVFCTLIRTRKNLSETDNIRLYLMKSLKHKILRESNKVNYFTRIHTDEDYSFDLRWSENLQEQLHDIDEERGKLISEAMQALTERQKEAIYLRFNRALEYEEISYLLNINYQSSRALIHRAIEKLREIIHIPAKDQSMYILHSSSTRKTCS